MTWLNRGRTLNLPSNNIVFLTDLDIYLRYKEDDNPLKDAITLIKLTRKIERQAMVDLFASCGALLTDEKKKELGVD
jgi:hypothetical protein